MTDPQKKKDSGKRSQDHRITGLNLVQDDLQSTTRLPN